MCGRKYPDMKKNKVCQKGWAILRSLFYSPFHQTQTTNYFASIYGYCCTQMKHLFLFLQRMSRLKLKHLLSLLCRRHRRSLLLLFIVLLLLSISISSSWFAIFFRRSEHSAQDDSEFDSSESNLFHKEKEADRILSIKPHYQHHYNFSYADVDVVAAPPPTPDLSDQGMEMEMDSGPYHNWQLFAADFEEMVRNLKIYVYPCIYQSNSSSLFAAIFLPHPNPFHPKLGNYFSEHMFKVALLRSSLLTSIPEEAHLFFLPFSVNLLRSDPRVHSESSISKFVAQYTTGISRDFPFWNASSGADHFYVCCHSVCREASSKHHDLHNTAIQVTCSSSYFQRYYITHKDVSFPQVWPRLPEQSLNPPDARDRLVYFSGRIQNSHIRQQLIALWGNDVLMDIFSGNQSLSYEEGFRRSRYCLHVRGYEVNTARVSDAIHYGCIPVIISNYYELPFANVLDWSKFSVIINQGDVAYLKSKLLPITRQMYIKMFQNLCQVRRHFVWHKTPRGYDSFHMTAYQLWLRRNIHHMPH